MENLISIGVKAETWQDCYQAWLTTRGSDSTRRVYSYSIRDFIQSTGATLADAGRKHVADWYTSMQKRSLSDGTIQLRLSALSSFYDFAATEYSITNEIGENMPLMQSTNPANGKAYRKTIRVYGKARPLSAEESAAFLKAVPTWTQNGKRDFALLLGYILMGRRNGEWRNATMDQFEMRDGRHFYRWSGKNSEDELIEVPGAVWESLSDYIHASGGRGMFDFIFLDRSGQGPLSERRIGQIVKRYAGMAGIEGRLRVHDLRHTAAMLRRKAGADIKEIQEFLNHRSPATTMVYIHRLEGVADNRGAQVAEMLKIKRH